MAKVYSGKEVALHNSRESCWIIVHGACLLLLSVWWGAVVGLLLYSYCTGHEEWK